MIFSEAIPEEVKKFERKNLEYVKTLWKSSSSKPEDLEKLRRELKLATTPKSVISQDCSVKLYRYTPKRKKLSPVPLVIVPSLILRYYIMDLMSEHSLIEALVDAGIDTYLVDWGIPGEEHGNLAFDYYVDAFLRRAIRKVRRATGCEKVNLLGQCLGGTISAMYSSIYPDEVNSLTLLTTPIDFEDAGLLALWTRKETFDVEKVVRSFGRIVPAGFIHACFQFLDVKATADRYKRLYDNVLDDSFMKYYSALDTWLNDKVPFPGKVFQKFIEGLYQDNLLVKGRFDINGKMANLANISCPVLNIFARFDHVFPESSSRKLNEMVSGPVNYHVIPAGHVTVIAVFPERFQTFKLISDFVRN